MDDQAMVKSVVRAFLSEAVLHLSEMEKLIDQKDWSALKNLLHKAKPGFGYVGLDEIYQELTLWHQELTDGRQQISASERFNRIKGDTLQALDAMRAYLSGQ